MCTLNVFPISEDLWLYMESFFELTEQLRQGLLDEDDTNQCYKGFFCESNKWKMQFLDLGLCEPTL